MATIIGTIMDIVNVRFARSNNPYKACRTHDLNAQEFNGKHYDFRIYLYTQTGSECQFAKSDDLEKVVEKGVTRHKPQDDVIGDCVTFYNGGQTVAYIKWRRQGTLTSYDEIWCTRLSGFGVPKPWRSSLLYGP